MPSRAEYAVPYKKCVEQGGHCFKSDHRFFVTDDTVFLRDDAEPPLKLWWQESCRHCGATRGVIQPPLTLYTPPVPPVT